MQKFKTILSVFIVVGMALSVFAACKGEAEKIDLSDFTMSTGLAENGFFEGVTAKDFVEVPEDISTIIIPKSVHAIDDGQISAEISVAVRNLGAEGLKTRKVKNRPVFKGDNVNIDYVGSVDGVEFERGSTDGEGTDVVAGDTNYIDDFLTQIIGAVPGDTIDVHVTFPDPYQSNTDLSGKDALFVTKINYIEEYTLTDKWVEEKLSEYEMHTVKEVRDYLGGNISQMALDGFVQTYLSTEANISSVPPQILEYQKKSALFSDNKQAAQSGMELDAFVQQNYGVESAAAFLEENASHLEQSARFYLAIQAFAEVHGINVTQDDVNSLFGENSQEQTEYGVAYLAQNVVIEKVFDLILEKATKEK
ncbi:MAG: FKBP-type peptidyl-prolyl cis-trans isomerase [Oscillospiraceae bacterium]|nr:FKBP-type peptidyl-prolyl cis-trans isomerase [Oscillospiraceae bacterium]